MYGDCMVFFLLFTPSPARCLKIKKKQHKFYQSVNCIIEIKNIYICW
jgi:hypothetical protein